MRYFFFFFRKQKKNIYLKQNIWAQLLAIIPSQVLGTIIAIVNHI